MGKKQGEGVMVWGDGRRYEGQWRSGHRHGSGMYTNAKGCCARGQWSKGQPVAWTSEVSTSSSASSTEVDSDIMTARRGGGLDSARSIASLETTASSVLAIDATDDNVEQGHELLIAHRVSFSSPMQPMCSIKFEKIPDKASAWADEPDKTNLTRCFRTANPDKRLQFRL